MPAAEKPIETLVEELTRLSKRGLCKLKSGTEVEDMGFGELGWMFRLACRSSLPMLVKIGGPEARNDMRRLLAMHCLDAGNHRRARPGILAPMVESLYALTNYTKALKAVAGPLYPYLYSAVNIETAQAVECFDAMLQSAAFADIDQVTVGRGDLSASLNLPIEDEEVTRQTSIVVKKSRGLGRYTSVGGCMTPASAYNVARDIKPHFVNTRHCTVRVTTPAETASLVAECLSFESKMYSYLAAKYPAKELAYKQRIAANRERLVELPPGGLVSLHRP